MSLPVRHIIAPRTPGQFIKVPMVLEKQNHPSGVLMKW